MLTKFNILLKSRFAKDVAITLLGQLIVLLVSFAINKILSIKLGTAGYGEYSIAKRTAGVVSFIMLACMGIAIPKYVATYKQLGDQKLEARFVFTAIIIVTFISTLISVIILIFRDYFAKIIFGDERYSRFIFPMLTYAFSTSLTSFVYSYYRGLDKFIIYNIAQIIVQTSTLILTLLIDGDVITLLYAWSFINGCYGIFVFIKLLWRYFLIATIESFNDLNSVVKELMSFCLPRIPGELVLFSYTVVPLILINYKEGLETSAYFAAATTINTIITPIFSVMGSVLLPFVSKSIASKKFSEAESKVKALSKIYLVIGSLSILFIELLTPFVVNLLFSSEFLPIVPIVRVMVFSILPNIFYLLLRNPLDAASKIPINTINLTISFMILNILILISSNNYAYAFSFVVSYGILGWLSYLAWKKASRKITMNN